MILRAFGLTLFIILFIPVMGVILDAVWMRVFGFLGAGLGFIVINFITFPGVIHHELSHALFAFITGAKIEEIVLFNPDFSNGTLGYVKYAARGGKIRQSLQHSLCAVAPMICGFTTFYLLICYLTSDPNIGKLEYLLWYFALSVLVHMTMSVSDLINYFRGIPICSVIVFIIVFISKAAGTL